MGIVKSTFVWPLAPLYYPAAYQHDDNSWLNTRTARRNVNTKHAGKVEPFISGVSMRGRHTDRAMTHRVI